MIGRASRGISVLLFALAVQACETNLFYPGPFTLVSPSDAQVDVSLSPVLTWTASTHAVTYELQIATDPDFKIMIRSDPGVTTTSEFVGGLAPSTTYYWRVFARNATGTTPATNGPFSFKTVPPLPGHFSMTTPAPGETDVSLLPTFSWTVSSDAATYSLQVATDAAFNSIVIDESGLVATSWTPSVPLAVSTTYYWKVGAFNVVGGEVATPFPRAFTTLPAAPGSFSLLSPSNGAGNVPRSPMLSWSASGGAGSYTVQVSTSAAFGTFVINQSGIVATSFSPGALLAPSTTYYWRVDAVNAWGSTSAGGAPYSFTTVPKPSISIAGGPLTFSASASGPNPSSQTLALTNPSGSSAALNWTIESDQPWLQFGPGAGSTTTETETLTVSAILTQAEAWTTSLSSTNAPSGQEDGCAVWTGKEMIVWGGHGPIGTMVNTGARYDPAADAWTGTTSLVGAPSPRWGHSAVWTGKEMIVWGGSPGGAGLYADGYRYDPATNVWSGPISTLGAPSPRRVHSAVWTGTEMIVWGGLAASGAVDTGARYNPATDTWSPVTMTGAPAPKSYHAAVWTGTEMIVFGGDNNLGLRYSPGTDTWSSPTSTVGAPVRNNACVVWTGTEMIVWSGHDGVTEPNTGVRYHAPSDTWQAMTTTNAPVGRRSGVAVWTGLEMIIWGGYDGAGFNNTGRRYVPPITLTPGAYTGTLTITDPEASNSPQTVGVTFNVGP